MLIVSLQVVPVDHVNLFLLFVVTLSTVVPYVLFLDSSTIQMLLLCVFMCVCFL